MLELPEPEQMTEIIRKSIFKQDSSFHHSSEEEMDVFPLLEKRVLTGIRISKMQLPDYAFCQSSERRKSSFKAGQGVPLI